MKVITVVNQKGGVGKTTTVQALGFCLADMGYKVLLLDLDAQCNLSDTLKCQNDEKNIYTIIKSPETIQESVKKVDQNLWAISGSLNISSADLEFSQAGREFLLREAMENLKEMYDYIIIDTPPTLAIMVVNAITISDYIVIPMCPDKYSLDGLNAINKTITTTKKYFNPKVEVAGVLMTQVTHTNISETLVDNVEDICKIWGLHRFNTTIRKGVYVVECQAQQKSLMAKKSVKVVQDYQDFASELLNRIGEKEN